MKLKALKVIGLNSGTSMDGIDAACFRISPCSAEKREVESRIPSLQVEMLAHTLYEFEPEVLKTLKRIVGAGQASLDEICRFDAVLGEEFARAAIHLLKKVGQGVDLIGSHGQTIWHSPQSKKFAGVYCSNSLQLGQSAVIAERTGIATIGDFRVQDLAAGGQGAPLVCFADQVLFGNKKKACAVLNIGGIANITVLAENGNALMAFDTGPGNMLSDRACQKLFSCAYDSQGKIAALASIDEEWLKQLMQMSYFSESPPKTTGRELFGFEFADELIEAGQKRGLKDANILATLAALTPASIAAQYDMFIRAQTRIEEIIIGGGGAENSFMLDELQRRWPHKLQISKHEDYGVSTRFKEALLFALLAYTSYFRIPNNVPACTGARRLVCLGKFCNP